jgi:hypothetical protein
MSRRPGGWIGWTTHRMCGAAGGDRGNSFLPAYASAGRRAWAAGVGGGADAAVGGRDDRGGLDLLASRLALRRAGRVAAVGVAGDRERGEPGGERGGGRACGYWAGDRRVALVRADRLIRAAHAPDPQRRGQHPHEQASRPAPQRGGERQPDGSPVIGPGASPPRSGRRCCPPTCGGWELQLEAWQ